MNTNWIGRLAGSTRGALLALLRESRRTISELSVTLGITDNAVRTHIAGLQRDGLVEQVGYRRDVRGKPAHVFDLTDSAEELFPKAYATVLAELIREVERRDGRTAVEALLKSVGERLGAGAPSAGPDLRARIDGAVALLSSLGGALAVQEVPGGYEVLGHGCPLSAVVRANHGACVVAESLIAAATDAPVSEHCLKTDRPRCAFHIAVDIPAGP